MTDTIISPDGTMMWTGTEWIPLPGHEGGDDADDPGSAPLSPEMENLERLERLIEGAEEKLSGGLPETHNLEPVPESPQYPPAEQTGRAWAERPWWQLGTGPSNRQPVGAEEKEELYIIAKKELKRGTMCSEFKGNRIPEAYKCLLVAQDIFLHTLDGRITRGPRYKRLILMLHSGPGVGFNAGFNRMFFFISANKYDKEAASDPMLPTWDDLPSLKETLTQSILLVESAADMA